MQYKKLPLTFEEQVKLLEQRGLIIKDKSLVTKTLSFINYYRLSAYLYPFRQRVDSDSKILDVFKPGTSWNMVYNLYEFDRKFRILVFNAIGQFEIALRTQIVYQLSHKYGSHWQDKPNNDDKNQDGQMNSGIFIVPDKHSKIKFDVYNEIQKHIDNQLSNTISETFINHYKLKYDFPQNPPSWMCIEIMYFSHLSKIFSGLKKRSDQVEIAIYFDLPPNIFGSWLHTVNYVRNICAHHARLWNRELSIVPANLHFSKSRIWIDKPNTIKRSKIYYFLCIMNYLLQPMDLDLCFKKSLIELIEKYKDYVDLKAMGFPKNWKNDKIWQLKFFKTNV